MARGNTVPINGEILRWAMFDVGMTVEELAKKLNVSTETVHEWRSGDSKPTAAQLRNLADKLDRPSAFFFRSEPPAQETTSAFFRGALNDAEREPTRAELDWTRNARRVQSVTARLSLQLELGRPTVPDLREVGNPEHAAIQARERLGISVSEQVSWKSASEAFRAWIDAVEAQRVTVFRLPMGRHAARGFALWNDWSPAVAVNTAYSWTEQRIFTLLHEYGHLTLRASVFDSEAIPAPTMADLPDMESWCNRFAAAVLLPEMAVSAFLRDRLGIPPTGRVTEVEQVKAISRRFKVSLRATAIRLIQLKWAEDVLYDKVQEQAIPLDYASSGGGGGGRKRPRMRIDQYGRNVPETLLEGLSQGLISEFDLVDYLDVGLDEIPDIQAELTAP